MSTDRGELEHRLIPPLWDLVFDLRGPELWRWKFESPQFPCYSLASSCGDAALMCLRMSRNNDVHIFDLNWTSETQTPPTVYTAPFPLYNSAWHPKEKNIFAFSGSHRRVFLGNYPEQNLHATGEGPTAWVSYVTFECLDGSQLYASSFDRLTYVFDTQTRTLLEGILHPTGTPVSLASTPDFLAIGASDGVIIRDLRRDSIVIHLGEQTVGCVENLDYDGKYLLAARSASGVNICDIRTWNTLRTIPCTLRRAWETVQFHDSHIICNENGNLLDCDLATGQFEKLLDDVGQFSISASGRLLATTHDENDRNTVKLWDIRDLKRTAL